MTCLAILGDLKRTVNAWKNIYHPRKVVESFKILLSLRLQFWLQALELTHFFLFTQYLHSSFRKKFHIKSFLSIKKTRFTSSKYRVMYLSFLTFLLQRLNCMEQNQHPNCIEASLGVTMPNNISNWIFLFKENFSLDNFENVVEECIQERACMNTIKYLNDTIYSKSNSIEFILMIMQDEFDFLILQY